MSTQRPRATPVALVLLARGASAPVPTLVPRALIGPIWVTWGHVSVELREGSLLIGRGAECDLVLEDPLVSRVHARVLLSSDGVMLEDLHSTNGVYLNGDRVMGAAGVNVGDRALLGLQEVAFSEIGTDPPPPSVSNADDSSPDSATPKPTSPLQPSLGIPITTRVDALDLVGTLARRLTNEKKSEEAPRLLGPQLRGILRGANSGLVVPDALSTLASEYALDLAHWTANSRWLDYVVELHLVTKRLMPTSVLTALQRAERWVGPLNRTLLEYYVSALTYRELPDQDERARLTMLKRLLKKK
jgi:pSer/pThr/pTyr-binding forkhead associated (FHA) protein